MMISSFGISKAFRMAEKNPTYRDDLKVQKMMSFLIVFSTTALISVLTIIWSISK